MESGQSPGACEGCGSQNLLLMGLEVVFCHVNPGISCLSHHKFCSLNALVKYGHHCSSLFICKTHFLYPSPPPPTLVTTFPSLCCESDCPCVRQDDTSIDSSEFIRSISRANFLCCFHILTVIDSVTLSAQCHCPFRPAFGVNPGVLWLGHAD